MINLKKKNIMINFKKKYYDKFKMKKQKLSFIAGLTDEIYIYIF